MSLDLENEKAAFLPPFISLQRYLWARYLTPNCSSGAAQQPAGKNVVIWHPTYGVRYIIGEHWCVKQWIPVKQHLCLVNQSWLNKGLKIIYRSLIKAGQVEANNLTTSYVWRLHIANWLSSNSSKMNSDRHRKTAHLCERLGTIT